ncbi:serine/threonine protein kinase [Allokutzneria sp. A3M-2-11 16]|uniref:serine/threonine-protein kinase n=1 Tax=Allokutzneria sp. A3M-2-11 16 TaxID=2962043 RepID=UPI0020B86898|nr:serine/threonine-protein kinase [Allokutzneria sp. A3M-2-11 16]MCP3804169.1 serine/threonine protein kinase [Allokutzneria sp. A3M-2-11 16]
MEPLKSVLEGLHRLFGFDVCPGDWAWTLVAAGALFGLMPTAGAATIALTRKVVGNRTSVATLVPFGLIAVVSTWVLPQLAMAGTSNVLVSMRAGYDSLAGSKTLFSGVCFGAVTQGDLLTNRAVGTVLANASWHSWVAWPALVGVPVLILISVFFQGMLAFRKGARFPVWLFTGSFAALFFLTLNEKAGAMGFLWAGFLLAAIIGPILIWLIGSPGQRAIDRASDAARARREAAREDRAPQLREAKPAMAEHGADQVDRRAIPQARPQPQQAPAPTRVEQPQRNQQHPPTRVDMQPPPYQAPQPPPVQPSGPPQGRPGLANTPGPLPFALGGPPPNPAPSSMGMAAGAAAMAAAAGVAGSGKAEMPQASGRFRRIRQLGEGGFGKVWLAMDTNLGRTVAIKLAHAPDAEAEERMLREARALASIRHPNCVRVYDLVNEGEGLAIVMEYIEGRSLSEVVSDDGLLDDVMAARLWVTMAGALSSAHSKGVLHRDMKPSNVIVDDAAIAHLIDFGIARKRGDSTLTAAGFMLGTPDFIAPEVAAGKSASPASDAWQLAATINYALSGQPPRGDQGDPASALLAAARGGGELHLPEKSAHRAMLAAALQPDPSRRPTLGTIEREVGTWLSRGGFKQDGPVTTMIHKSQLAKTRVAPPKPHPTPPQAAPTQKTPGSNPLGGSPHSSNPLGDETKRVDEHHRPPHPGPGRRGPTPTRKF